MFRNNHRSPVLSATIGITALIVFLFLGIPQSIAGKGCEWEGSNLACRSGWAGLATGCIGLKNVSGYKVKFGANSTYRIMENGKTKQADFKGKLHIQNCRKKVSGKWEFIRCYSAFDRKKNTNSGGGCGCEDFKCLPKP